MRRLLIAPLGAAAAGVLAAGAYQLTGGDPLWWLLNTEPPAVQATAPAGPLRGVLAVEAHVSPAAQAALAGATLDGQPLALSPAGEDTAVGDSSAGPTGRATGTPMARMAVEALAAPGGQGLRLDTATLPDGPHLLTLEAVDRSRRHNRGRLELAFTSDNTPPQVRIEPSVDTVRAGVPLVVRWGADEPADLRATWDGTPLPALVEVSAAESGPVRFSIVAVPVESPAGQTTLRVEATDVAGNAGSGAASLPVEAATPPSQALEVPAPLAPLATGPVARDEAARVAELTRAARPERLWTAPFRPPLPAAAPRTTGFGDRREYADGYVIYHAGYDLAAPAGTPVGAAAEGEVAFAGELPQRGNTLILDHGWGIYTVYAHLLRFEVEAGQRVTAGQPVGRVGTTGLSTGPHLHWEVRLRGLPVDPGAWIALSAQLTPPG